MRAVVTRVKEASVTIDGKTVGAINSLVQEMENHSDITKLTA